MKVRCVPTSPLRNVSSSALVFDRLRSWRTSTSTSTVECVEKILAHTLRRSMCSEALCFAAVGTILYDHNFVRVAPVVLAATRSAPPVALLFLLLLLLLFLLLLLLLLVAVAGP